jgi:hypothetical protein
MPLGMLTAAIGRVEVHRGRRGGAAERQGEDADRARLWTYVRDDQPA